MIEYEAHETQQDEVATRHTDPSAILIDLFHQDAPAWTPLSMHQFWSASVQDTTVAEGPLVAEVFVDKGVIVGFS